GCEAASDLNRALRGLANRQRTVCQMLAQRFSLEQLHDRISMAFVRTDVENRQDVRMRQRRDRLGFPFEPREAIGIVGERRWEDLDRDKSIETRIARFVVFAHPTSAEGRDNLVRAEAGSSG